MTSDAPPLGLSLFTQRELRDLLRAIDGGWLTYPLSELALSGAAVRPFALRRAITDFAEDALCGVGPVWWTPGNAQRCAQRVTTKPGQLQLRSA